MARCCGVLITASLDDPNNPLGSPNGKPGLLAQRAVGPLTAVKQLFRLNGIEENFNWGICTYPHTTYIHLCMFVYYILHTYTYVCLYTTYYIHTPMYVCILHTTYIHLCMFVYSLYHLYSDNLCRKLLQNQIVWVQNVLYNRKYRCDNITLDRVTCDTMTCGSVTCDSMTMLS